MRSTFDLGVFVLGHVVGTVRLGLAMWRARMVSTWAGSCLRCPNRSIRVGDHRKPPSPEFRDAMPRDSHVTMEDDDVVTATVLDPGRALVQPTLRSG